MSTRTPFIPYDQRIPCPVPECHRVIPAWLFMCSEHWQLIPRSMRRMMIDRARALKHRGVDPLTDAEFTEDYRVAMKLVSQKMRVLR